MSRPSTEGADGTQRIASRKRLRNRWRCWGAGAVLLVPCIELAMHLHVQRGVVRPSDWSAATAYVRARFRAGDLVVTTPSWADPIARWQLGDLSTLSAAGRSDDRDHDRIWVLGAYHAPAPREISRSHTLTSHRAMGRVQVQRWERSAGAHRPHVLYDFVDKIAQARAYLGEPGRGKECAWRSASQDGTGGGGGGLSAGPYTPANRFVCDEQRGWLWVGATMLEDLQLQPRWCVWQHPAQPQEGPVVTEFSDVPLGRTLVLHAGLYYEHERSREGGPVTVEVWVNDRKLGQLQHRDGDGWARQELPTPHETWTSEGRARVQVRVHAPDPHLRTLCWAMKAVR
jgi:hypothetical protein